MKKIIKKDRVRFGDVYCLRYNKAEQIEQDATVEVVKEGGIVHHLKVTCPCGKITDILCQYGDTGDLNDIHIADQQLDTVPHQKPREDDKEKTRRMNQMFREASEKMEEAPVEKTAKEKEIRESAYEVHESAQKKHDISLDEAEEV